MVLLMPARSQPAQQAKSVRKRGAVISISSGKRGTPKLARPLTNQTAITQARLAQALEFHKEEIRITAALREFRLQLEADLMNGAEVENGDLFFDRELKVVRRHLPNGALGR